MKRKVILISSLFFFTLGKTQENKKDSTSLAEFDKITQLQTLELVGRSRKDYNSDYSFSSSKIALKNMEIAQSMTTVTKELLADRQIFRVGDAMKNVSGVSPTSFYYHYSIRGITQAASYKQNRLVNGMNTSVYFFNQPLTVNIERIEVIKGPASMAFSSTDPGGSINMVTKKPLKYSRNEVSFTVGSYGMVRGALDFTGPLNKSKSLLYRLNMGYENSQSFRDLQFKKAFIVAPTISYVPNDKTSLNFELVLSDDNSRLDRGQPIFGVKKGQFVNLNSTPINFSVGNSNDHNRNIDLTIMGNLTHKFTDKFGLNMTYMKHIWDEDLIESRTNNSFAKDKNGNPIPTKVEMRYVQRKQKFFTDNFNAYFNMDWGIGEVKNKSVLGYDLIAHEVSRTGGWNEARDYRLKNGGIGRFRPGKSNIADFMTDANGNPLPNVPHFDLQNPQYFVVNQSDFVLNRRKQIIPQKYVTNGIYLMNQLEWGKFIFNFGLRQEWYADYNNYKLGTKQRKVNQNKFLKRFGLIYKATGNINAYASYIEGFQIQTDAYIGTDALRQKYDPKTGKEYYSEPFSPSSSKMIEGGLKTEWLGGKLHANIAYFNIHQLNFLTPDKDSEANGYEGMNQGASQRSQGIEIDVMGRILPNWQINTGYAFIDANLKEGGKKYRKENTPVHSFNLWTRYDLKSGIFKNFGVGAGVNYSGSKIAWLDRSLSVPSYTIVDGAVYYKLRDMQIAVNVNNIFNKKYWIGAFNYTRLFPGAPRNVMLNVKYTF